MKSAITLLSFVAALGGQVEDDHPEKPIPQTFGAQAVISGIKPEVVYEQLPPALVELRNLPAGTSVWVEIWGADGERSSVVEARFMPNPNGAALLPLGGLASRFDRDGEWTMQVLTRSPGGPPTCLARASFQLESTEAGSAAPMPKSS